MDRQDSNALFMSPQQGDISSLNPDFTPDLDYLEGDSFDFDNADLGGEMIGALPGNGEHHEKRKNSDDEDEEGGDAKRQETQEGEKGAKKPGRKPLTSEPTTKRKAQNRAAQRAFRERKEKHLKDLETKVNELTKEGEADKHENGLLKAQVERLQVELKDYRKRLSLNAASGGNRSPPVSAYGTGSGLQKRSSSNPAYDTNFQFDFPKFGAAAGTQVLANQNFSSSDSTLAERNSATPPASISPSATHNANGSYISTNLLSRENSTTRSISPRSVHGSIPNVESPMQVSNLDSSFNSYSSQNNMHGFASTLPQMGNTTSNDPFGDLFSPSILKSASMENTNNYFANTGGNGSAVHSGSDASATVQSDRNGGDSTAGLNRVFQFNSNSSTSDSASPDASSSSQWNLNGTSSCGTSPEPSHGSPASKLRMAESMSYDSNNSTDALNKTASNSTVNPNSFLYSNQNDNNNNNFDLSEPSMQSFDPVLFGDYRDTSDALLGNGDFTGGFFDDALGSGAYNLGSPSNLFGILQSPTQMNANLEPSMNGKNDEAATATTTTANNINSMCPKASTNLMAQIDKTRDGGDEDYGLPGSTTTKTSNSGNKLVNCTSIWSQLQSNSAFQDGKFDLDNLCSELKTKARCSDSGVMIDQDHVDAALRKLGGSMKDGVKEAPPEAHMLMFEQESWDNVLRKLDANKY